MNILLIHCFSFAYVMQISYSLKDMSNSTPVGTLRLKEINRIATLF